VLTFLVRRSLHALATTLVAAAIIFLAVRLLPNNPVLARYGQHVTPEKVSEEMQEHGWDQPLWRQLLNFVSGLVQGDLGKSFVINPGVPITSILARTLPATIELTLAAMLLAVPLGVLAGAASAVWRNRLPDMFFSSAALLGVSIPVFFLGICMLSVFTNMPTGMRMPPMIDYPFATGFYLLESLARGQFNLFAIGLRQICLPAVALSTIPMAVIARISRSSLIDVLDADFIRTAKAKGAGFGRVLWRHALPNASVPIVNIAGFQLGMLLSGAVLTETVFSWPGLGREMVEAVKASDYAIVQGGALVIALLFTSLNLVLDLAYMWLDPRIRRSA
jgi:peptide/nickel transport system permease protein